MKHTMPMPLLTAVGLAALLAACSSVPERNSELDRARSNFASAQAEPQVLALAADEMKRAADTLDMAQGAWTSGQPKANVDHLAYMTSQRVNIARATASGRSSEAVTAGAAAERDRMRLALRTMEVDQTRRQLTVSEQVSALKSVELAQVNAAAQRDQVRADTSDARASASDARANESDARLGAIAMQLEALNAKKTERGYVVTLGDVLFDTGQARLLQDSGSSVARLADVLKRNPGTRASIEGYTDSVGSDSANVELSDRRAMAVMSALAAQGVAAGQMSARGFGERMPTASNDTPTGRQMNRRVEIIFSPL